MCSPGGSIDVADGDIIQRQPSEKEVVLLAASNNGGESSQSTTKDEPSSAAAIVVNTRRQMKARLRRPCCSLNQWSRRRIKFAACGCLTSAIVCGIRLYLDRSPSAYIIHSIIVLFDMVLIHIFTYTMWLSVAGEITAIVFALCFHLTNEKIFELLETTLIAALVSIHMIQSRDEHWDKEKDLEKDIIGLQLYIEHYATNNNHDVDDINVNDDVEANVKGSSGVITRRRHSSFSGTVDRRRRSSINNQVPDKNGVPRRQDSLAKSSSDDSIHNRRSSSVLNEVSSNTEIDVETGGENDNISTFSTSRTTVHGGERKQSCWDHFFHHFLDGSAGVLYTSFVGLIIDEIVNQYW